MVRIIIVPLGISTFSHFNISSFGLSVASHGDLGRGEYGEQFVPFLHEE